MGLGEKTKGKKEGRYVEKGEKAWKGKGKKGKEGRGKITVNGLKIPIVTPCGEAWKERL